MKTPVRCSVVVPVYNSESTLSEVVDRTVATCEQAGVSLEMILVNDGSRDQSWKVIESECNKRPLVIGVDLVRNYGQHTALFAGMGLASGLHVITLDDDLQNPPEEIPRILAKAEEGFDVVFGQFRKKRHPLYRRVVTRIADWVIGKTFDKPKGLSITSFSCYSRNVVGRLCDYRGNNPFIHGLALMQSRNVTGITVEHEPRQAGSSGYGSRKMLDMAFRIIFNYSVFPLRFVSALGLIATVFAFAMAAYVLVRAMVIGIAVPGWATLAVMLSFFNGVTLLIISMLGEYVVRLLRQSNQSSSFHIRQVLRG